MQHSNDYISIPGIQECRFGLLTSLERNPRSSLSALVHLAVSVPSCSCVFYHQRPLAWGCVAALAPSALRSTPGELPPATISIPTSDDNGPTRMNLYLVTTFIALEALSTLCVDAQEKALKGVKRFLEDDKEMRIEYYNARSRGRGRVEV